MHRIKMSFPFPRLFNSKDALQINAEHYAVKRRIICD